MGQCWTNTIRISFVQVGGLLREKRVYSKAVDERQEILETDSFMNKNKKRTKGRAYQNSVCGKLGSQGICMIYERI